MGAIGTHRPVLFLAAVFSRHEVAFNWARNTLSAAWGPLACESARFEHAETRFYESSMGAGLQKCFFAFAERADPAMLVERKWQANAWEQQYAAEGGHSEERPLNIDPGYLTEAKLVLATTKDRDHRLYLDRGIYAEVTLHFHHGQWTPRPWTYPDYCRADYHAFFTECRNWLRAQERT
jgi:hypothetical protein